MTHVPDLTDRNNIRTRTIIYGVDGHPISINSSSSTRVTVYLHYHFAGERAAKVSHGITTFYFDNYELQDNQSILYVKASFLRIAHIAGGTVHYYHKDHFGSTNLITDQNCDVIESVGYMPYDNTKDKLIDGYAFANQQYNPETVFCFFSSRHYDPVIGRFLMADTLIPDVQNPKSLNPYSYCYNDPVNNIDLSGHIPLSMLQDVQYIKSVYETLGPVGTFY